MLADVVLSKSLHLQIPWRFEDTEEARQTIPIHSFGVFVTARRANPIPKWPHDIHGCIGYWNPEYQEESRATLLEKACEVGYKAFWEDDRRHSFSRHVLQEPETRCEIDFMMLPVIPVDPLTGNLSNGKQFDNSVYGLIVESLQGHATYLPGVFPRSSWKYLKMSLLAKASISSGRYYAYKIRQISLPIGSICQSKNVSLCLQESFKKLLFQHIHTSYPFFPIHYKNESFQYDKKEEVRNTGLLLDMVEAFQAGIPFTKAQESYLSEAIAATARMPLSDQSKAFLLPCLSAMGFRTEYLCRDMVETLKEAEREFQFGETVVGIAKGGCKHLLLPYRKLLLQSYPLVKPDSIFQINWDCQALVAIGKKPFPKIVLDSLLTVLGKLQISEETFTNVLAVSWECIQTVYPHCSLYYKKHLDFYRLYILWLLQQRIDASHPTIYKMLQGDARLDITSHVLGGWKFEEI